MLYFISESTQDIQKSLIQTLSTIISEETQMIKENMDNKQSATKSRKENLAAETKFNIETEMKNILSTIVDEEMKPRKASKTEEFLKTSEILITTILDKILKESLAREKRSSVVEEHTNIITSSIKPL